MKTAVGISLLISMGIAPTWVNSLASSIQIFSSSYLLQQGRELYQNEQFAQAVEIWEQAYTKGCGASGSIASKNFTSKFIITGRGGLPPTPTEVLRSDLALADLGTSVKQAPTAKTIAINKPIDPESNPIFEAQGWVISPKGQVMLTASAPEVIPEVSWLKTLSCHNF